MKLFDKEHDELIQDFDKLFKYENLDKESHDKWKKSIIYCDGKVNKLFLAYRHGYAIGLLKGRLQI